MTKLNGSTDEMFDTIEWATNGSLIMNGRMDAVAHIGKLVSGEWTPEFLADVQSGHDEYLGEDGDYIKGYTEAWNALYNLLRGVSIDELHK